MSNFTSGLVAILLIVGNLIPLEVDSASEDQLKLVSTACKNDLQSMSIEDFKIFLDSFYRLEASEISNDSALKRCLKYREAILNLRELITTEQVCDIDRIDRLIEYHRRYLKTGFIVGSKPIIQDFFTKYAIQVAYTCKKNIIRNLEIAKEELKDRGKVFQEAKDKIYRDEPSLKSNIRLMEEQPDDPVSTNVKPCDEAEISLSEYREALIKLKHPEDILTFETKDCERSSQRDIKISMDKVQVFFKPALICHQLHRYYAGSILSVARLANHGYIATDHDLDRELAENSNVKDWLVAAQVCGPLLHMTTKNVEGSWVVVDTCAKSVPIIEPMVHEDRLIEVEADVLEDMVRYSKTTRNHAQKMMKSAMKRMAKIDLMKQIKSGATKRSIFSKSLQQFNMKGSDSLSLDARRPSSDALGKFIVRIQDNGLPIPKSKIDLVQHELSDKESYELLMKTVANQPSIDLDETEVEGDSPVSVFDPFSTLTTTLTVMLIMLSFEWLFFVVMTLAARLCHHLYFNFENLLTFPPKFLSWSDADFARLNDKVENMDEDDFFDYDELTEDEQQHRDLLAKVFGQAPPMLYKD